MDYAARRGERVLTAATDPIFQTAHSMNMASRSRGPEAREFGQDRSALNSEGAGNAGRPLRPQPRVQMKKAHEHSHHGHTGSPGIPRAMVLTVFFWLSPVPGLVCHRHQRFRKLDASVGASGPHDFAVRVSTV